MIAYCPDCVGPTSEEAHIGQVPGRKDARIS